MIPDLHALSPTHIDRVLPCPFSSLADQVQQCFRRGDQVTVTICSDVGKLRHEWRLPDLWGALVLDEHQLGVRAATEACLHQSFQANVSGPSKLTGMVSLPDDF